jgi:hypothetical protein
MVRGRQGADGVAAGRTGAGGLDLTAEAAGRDRRALYALVGDITHNRRARVLVGRPARRVYSARPQRSVDYHSIVPACVHTGPHRRTARLEEHVDGESDAVQANQLNVLKGNVGDDVAPAAPQRQT